MMNQIDVYLNKIKNNEYRKIYFTSDHHFDNEKVRTIFNRPFKNVELMNEHLINIWNSKVTENDLVIYNGDFGYDEMPYNRMYEILKQLNFDDMLFIQGNHDDPFNIVPICNTEFRGIIKDHYFHIYHYPISVWDRSHKGSIHLYGHVHNAYKWIPEPKNRLDISVDANNWAPISYEEIIEKIK